MIAFNSVFARIWQFLIGFLVQFRSSSLDAENAKNPDEESEKLLETDENEEVLRENNYTIIPYNLIFGLLLILFFPVPLDSKFVRPLSTISTGLLIFFSESDQKILCNRVLVYFGNISYALYLVHWPIYAYWKLTRDGDHVALLLALLASILFSVIIHETFEKWYLQQSLTIIGVLSALLLILSAVLINKDGLLYQLLGYQQEYDSFSDSTVTLDDAARLNHRWNLNDYQSLFVPTCHYEGVNTPFGWCTHSKKGLTGDLKMMIIGNSWAANHASMFYEECGHLATSMVQGAASACEPLYPTRLSDVCKSNFTDFEEHIRKEKPDYVFMFTRFVTIGDSSPPQNDPIYQIMKRQLQKFLTNIRHKLYILHAMPRPNIEYIEEIVPMIRNGKFLEFIDNLLVNHTLYKTARRRYTQLLEDCNGKCVLVDYNPEFWDEESQNFRFFDKNGLSYFTTTTHLTPRGIEHIRHVWRDICRRLPKRRRRETIRIQG